MNPALAIATPLQTSRDSNGAENGQTGYVFQHASLGLRRPERANGLPSAAPSSKGGEGHKASACVPHSLNSMVVLPTRGGERRWDFTNRNPLPFAKAWRGLRSQSLLLMSEP